MSINTWDLGKALDNATRALDEMILDALVDSSSTRVEALVNALNQVRQEVKNLEIRDSALYYAVERNKAHITGVVNSVALATEFEAYLRGGA